MGNKTSSVFESGYGTADNVIRTRGFYGTLCDKDLERYSKEFRAGYNCRIREEERKLGLR